MDKKKEILDLLDAVLEKACFVLGEGDEQFTDLLDVYAALERRFEPEDA